MARPSPPWPPTVRPRFAAWPMRSARAGWCAACTIPATSPPGRIWGASSTPAPLTSRNSQPTWPPPAPNWRLCGRKALERPAAHPRPWRWPRPCPDGDAAGGNDPGRRPPDLVPACRPPLLRLGTGRADGRDHGALSPDLSRGSDARTDGRAPRVDRRRRGLGRGAGLRGGRRRPPRRRRHHPLTDHRRLVAPPRRRPLEPPDRRASVALPDPRFGANLGHGGGREL